MATDKKYVGVGFEGHFEGSVNINLEVKKLWEFLKQHPELKEEREYEGEKIPFVRISIDRKREPKGKMTHNVYINEWKPDGKQKQESKKDEDLPW